MYGFRFPFWVLFSLVGVWQVTTRCLIYTTFTYDQSGKGFHCLRKSIWTVLWRYKKLIHSCFLCNLQYCLVTHLIRHADKSMSVIGWGVLRVYANVKIVWRCSFIVTYQTPTSERRRGMILIRVGWD